MFIPAKLAGAFLLPPGLLILLAVLGLILLRLRRRKAAAALFLTVSALLYLLSIEPVKDALILPLENTHPPLAESGAERAEMIVILGGGLIASSPEEGGRAALTPAALRRVYYGARLQRRSGLPVLVAGGRPRRSDESEARAAARVLAELGVPPDRILVEEESRNTWENAAAVKARFSPGPLLLVTSAFHMPRSFQAFRRQSLTCLPAPTDYRGRRGGYTLLSFLPSPEELADSCRALKEYGGLFCYSLPGGK